jgi:hypothetical protein
VAERTEYQPEHWSHYTTADLEQLLESLQAMERRPHLTISGVKFELERRRQAASD